MSLNAEQLYAVWAPSESRWSAWAKPVLFAFAPLSRTIEMRPLLPLVDNFAPAGGTAVVVDLDGADSVRTGLALAEIGYRPVPLYNSGVSPGMIIDMSLIAEYLTLGAEFLRRCAPPPEAPPAFLLNAERMAHRDEAMIPGRYDNRWCVVPQDMPSAAYLMAAGINQVVLVADSVRTDISHVLCRYQDAGMTLRHAKDVAASPVALVVKRPSFYRSIWYRLGVFAGLRRNSAGGFGGWVPEPSSSGGFGG